MVPSEPVFLSLNTEREQNIRCGLRTTSGECAMYRVEGDVIHRVYKSLIFVVRNGIASMAFEREIAPDTSSDLHGSAKNKLAVNPSPQHTLK